MLLENRVRLFQQIEKLELSDDIISDSKKISEICNDHFLTVGERLFGQIPCSDNSPTAHIPKTNSVFQLRPVTEEYVLKLLHKLINGKATGVHNIPNRVLKRKKVLILSDLLRHLFLISLSCPELFQMTRRWQKLLLPSKEEIKMTLVIFGQFLSFLQLLEFLKSLYMYVYFLNNALLGDGQSGFRSLHSAVLAFGKVINT